MVFLLVVFSCERDRERKKERERDRERQRETERQRDRETERERENLLNDNPRCTFTTFKMPQKDRNE